MSMEQGSKPESGIPRLSRLPVPHGSLRESVTTTRQSVTSFVARGSCNANGGRQQRWPDVGIAARTESTSLSKGNNVLPHEPIVASNLGTPRYPVVSGGDSPGTSGDASDHDVPLFEPDEKVRPVQSDPASIPPETPRAKRKPRPSLSDRTIKTLSQLPPSPSSNRRSSSFFNVDTTSPMRPPLRPASAMSNLRSRPSSTIKPPPVPALPLSFAAKPSIRSTPNRRLTTQPGRPTARPPVYKTAKSANNPNTPGFKPNKDLESYKPTLTIRQIKSSKEKQAHPRPLPRKPVTRRQHAPAKSNETYTATGSMSAMSTPTTASLSSYGSRRSSAHSLHSCYTEVEGNFEAPSKSFSKSSATLRCAIAKAKQEVVCSKASVGHVRQSTATFPDARLLLGPQDDPLIFQDEGGLLRNRIKVALRSGHLNMAAMDFRSIPAEIEQMYDVHEDASINWSECVDLTKFVAADNKLEKLEDDIFPDVTNAELEDAEAGEHNGQLRGLEALDLHNNLLNELPLGMRRLQKLHSLNLSGNKLGEHALNIVCQIGDTLTDLRMSENKLSGMLPNYIKNLSNLQVLDLHGNNISALPEGLQKLIHLRTLNLAQNRLSSISPELLVELTLVELVVSGNRLSGVLFPPHIQSTGKSLKLLDVSHNALEAITRAEISLPNVQTLNLNGNRIKCFPDISSWEGLLTLAAAENLLCEMPPGLTTLRKLRNADFSNNNIAKLHGGIASMENLILINLAGNPLRERKYLTMSTQDLKADLQKRGLGVSGTQEVDPDSPISISSSKGTVDWSSRSMSEFKVPTADLDGPIYDLRLHHNALNAIPVSLISHPSVSETLKSLDVSHNAFQASYLSIPVTLPRLKDLSLASCQLKCLDGLNTNIAAPNLTTLNVSTNHLTGALPRLRTHFPTLTTLFVADNHFSVLEVAAAQGLITLDIRNNEIEHLEPRLGLLGGRAGLKCLEVSGNKFRVPRWDILAKGTEAVLGNLKARVPLEELRDEAAGVGEM